jgi:methyl-accepting chemotaxis protein
MRSPLRFLFLRTTLKVEFIIYLVPVPVLIYFSFFAFKYANAYPTMFMVCVTAAITVALAGGSVVRWLQLRPMSKLSRPELLRDSRALTRAARSAYTLPLVESASVFLRWLLSPGLFITLPFALMGRITPIEIVSTSIFTGITGLVSIPLVYHICESESGRFFESLRKSGVVQTFSSPVRVGITARLVVTLLLVIAYPAGLFLHLIILSNVGYLDLKTIPVGFGLLIFCSILLSVVVAVLFSRSVALTLQGMIRNLEGVSKGDLTMDIAVRDGDEVGELAQHYNAVIEALGSSVQSVRESAQRLAQWVSDISSASEVLAKASANQQAHTQSVLVTVEQFSSSLQAMTSRIATHAQTVAESAASVEQLSAGVSSIARGAEAVRETVSENVASISRGKAKIQSSIDETMRMNESLGRVSTSVREIGGRFQQIEETLVILQEIAGQTNTLAMNAAIEAAHAGDAGRGFAIVASEVRRLAERSSQFVKEIGSVMTDIGQQIVEAVHTAEAGEETSRAGRSAAEDAQHAVEGIMRSIDRIDKTVDEISRTTGEQAQAASHALASIDALREFSKSVSQEVEAQATSARQITQAIKAIGETTNTNTRSSRDLSELAAALKAKSEELAVTVSRFRLREADDQ